MAQQIITTLVDDIDGGEATETVTFALDGITYTIDLNAPNAAALRENLAQFITAGRRVQRRTARPYQPTTLAGRREKWERTSTVRAWAHAQGLMPATHTRGRISAEVFAAYDAAHQS